MVMVTHNPDLECYANRILYIHNGLIEKQVINTYQCQYYPEEYQEMVNSKNYSVCLHFSSVLRHCRISLSLQRSVDAVMKSLVSVSEDVLRTMGKPLRESKGVVFSSNLLTCSLPPAYGTWIPSPFSVC